MVQHGRLENIWRKRFHRGPMDPIEAGELIEGIGLLGNARQGARRQVTIIATESWEAMMGELNAGIDPSSRRANLMVSGLRLERTLGSIIEIGECRLEVMGETTPCERMDEALPGLRDAMTPEWRGGVFARVLSGGTVRVGDEVVLRPATPAGLEAVPTV